MRRCFSVAALASFVVTAGTAHAGDRASVAQPSGNGAALTAYAPDGFRKPTAAERKDMKRLAKGKHGVYGYFVADQQPALFAVICYGDERFVALRRASTKARFKTYDPTSGGLQTYQLACSDARVEG